MLTTGEGLGWLVADWLAMWRHAGDLYEQLPDRTRELICEHGTTTDALVSLLVSVRPDERERVTDALERLLDLVTGEVMPVRRCRHGRSSPRP